MYCFCIVFVKESPAGFESETILYDCCFTSKARKNNESIVKLEFVPRAGLIRTGTIKHVCDFLSHTHKLVYFQHFIVYVCLV